MSSTRPPGFGDQPPSQKVQQEMAQRVEKVGDVDPDEQARKQQLFQQMMEDSDEDEDIAPKLTRSPSPFETDFYFTNTGARSNQDSQPVPSPSYASPPNTSSTPTPEKSDNGLPHSKKFWKKVDSSEDPIPNLKYKEEPNGKQTMGITTETPKKKALEPSPFGPPGKPTETSSNKTSSSSLQKTSVEAPFKESATSEENEETTIPTGRYWESEKNALPTNIAGTFKEAPKDKEKNLIKTKKSISEEPEKSPNESQFQRPEPLTSQKEDFFEKKEKPTVAFSLQNFPQVPQNIQPMAMQAMQTAAPYLSAEAQPLFYQMISMIYIAVSKSGINTTEVVLNSPAFAGSKFYGSRITIAKYATAPNMINIRLSGSSEAVTTFNANIPSLAAAFQSGQFKFQVSRLEAEYSSERAEKPTFRRKDSNENSSFDQDERQ